MNQLRVKGRHTLNPEIELAAAKLIRKPTGLYIRVLTYSKPKPIKQTGAIGIDFGVTDAVTVSDGTNPDLAVEFPDNLRNKHRKFSRKQTGSVWYRKCNKDLTIAYERYSNQKKDKANKFSGYLKNFKHIGYQNDNVAGWKIIWGRKIQQSALGLIKEKLQGLSTAHEVDRFIPTTKECPRCLKINDLGLDVRTYACACGFIEHRDTKSAKAILCYSLCSNKLGKALTSAEYRSLSVKERASIYESYDFGISTSVDTESLSKTYDAFSMPRGLAQR
jgi:putative transposase